MANDQRPRTTRPRTKDQKGLFWDKIIEAGWLAAAIVTPLFFSWYSNRVFEASKVGLLRSITLVMLAAWLSKVLEARSWKLEIGNWRLEVGSWKQKAATQHPISNIQHLMPKTPLLFPILLLVAIYILTTITSIAPRISFWGSYERRQGLYVLLCYVAIFLLTLDNLRSRRQLERLITVILLTSLPVSLYGIMQHYGVDPLVWIRGDVHRVESTLGNPILIGAYLIMVIPLTVWQLIRSFSLIHAKVDKAAPSLTLFGCYLLLSFLQLICLVFTQSRGPAMGFVAGALFFFLLLAALRGQKGWALATVGVSIALLAILAILNLPHSPLAPPKGMPYIGRLAEISRDILHDRSLIWQGAVNMITADKIRSLIGYGPESMGLVFYPYIHPDWAALHGYAEIADRSHNETLDALVTGGLLGLVAYLMFFGNIFYCGLKWLGLIANSRQRTLFTAILFAGGGLGVLIPWLMEGTLKWVGVGIPAGILLALVAYLMTILFYRGKEENLESKFQILLIALLSALVAHFVEIQFGIAITATRTYFWIYAALLVIVGYNWQQRPELRRRAAEGEEPAPETAAEAPPPDSSRRRRGRQRRRPGKLRSPKLKTQSSELLAHSLLVGLVLATSGFDLITHQFDLRANTPVIFGLLFATWLFGAMPILTSNIQYPISNISLYALGSLFCFIPFIATHAAIALPGTGVERLVAIYYAYLFLVILVVAGGLMIGSKSNFKRQTLRLGSGQASNVKRQTLSFGFWMFWILSFLLIFNTNLKTAQADIYYKFGLSSEEMGKIDEAIAIYGRAIQLAPRWEQYYASLGWAYGLKAATASDAHQEAALFEESLEALEHAYQMSPLDPDIIAKLGYVYWNWGGLTSDPEQRAEKLEAALSYYQQAVTLSPLNHGHLLKDNIVQAGLHLGEIYTDLGKLGQAAEAYQKASEMAPDSYESHKGLALVYRQLGRLDEALAEAKTARDLAPEEERVGLDNLISQIEAEKP